MTHAMNYILLTLALPLQLMGSVDFNRDIRPILSDKCFHCHGPDEEKREAELRLDSFEGATEGGEFATPIAPGKPDESEVMIRILESDPDEIMPPPQSHKKITKKEIDLIRQWITEGAKYDEPWTYKNPIKYPAPSVKTELWPTNWVDQFILHRLETEHLAPSADADPVTLLRRLHFDLTGLPPTPKDAARFTSSFATNEQKAIKDEVDHLLASPAYGERLATYWLDLVRYADTVGYHGDQDHNISPYRDYVINAFNMNLPFDQFTREQLAGDLLPNPTEDQQVATGYNRLLQTTHEGGLQPAEYRAIYEADRVRNVSSVWMGATVGCAQCHDHKYDPYTAKDFHALGAFFADIDDESHFKSGTNSLPTRRPPEIRVFNRQQREKMNALNILLDELSKGKRTEISRLISDISKQKEQLSKENNPLKKKEILDSLKINEDTLASLMSENDLNKWKKVDFDLKKIDSEGRLTMVTVALKTPRIRKILPRGNWLDETGDVVQPAVPHFMPQIEKQSRQNRLDLANWLTDPNEGIGGLTARVIANRLFYLYFGTGLSRSLGDFGGQGVPPSNPELLDRLAVEFYESGWDLKHMIRLLVTSRAYRQSSLTPSSLQERDPYNELIARQSRYRLPAEMIRDNALAVSGLLVNKTGGPSIKPYQPAGYYRHLNFPPRKYRQDSSESIYRRSVYMHWQRQFLHPMLRAFDSPTREECTAKRPRSNTPVAAMNLLNDPTFVEAARALAQRVLIKEKRERERLDHIFIIALNRSPSEEERKELGELFTYAKSDFQKNPDSARALINVGLSLAPENHDAVELASWTTVTRAILNLSETTTRN